MASADSENDDLPPISSTASSDNENDDLAPNSNTASEGSNFRRGA